MVALLALLLCFFPLEEGSNRSDYEVGAVEYGSDYLSALQAVQEGTIAASTEPSMGFQCLSVALRKLADYAPLVAADPYAQQLQLKGQLALARAALILDDRQAATEAMDRVLVRLSLSGAIDDFPVDSVGPTLSALYHERRAELDAGYSARLVVTCPPDSVVFVDTREVSTTLVRSHGVEVTLGDHWIWVERGNGPPFRDIVELGTDTRDFAVHVPDLVPPPTVDAALATEPARVPATLTASPPAVRTAPRWLEVPVVALGLGQVGAGFALLAESSPCANEAAHGPVCSTNAKLLSSAIVTTGISLTALGTVMLVLDETWSRRHKRRGARRP